MSLIGILDSQDKDNAEVVKLRDHGVQVICLGGKK